jgi:hypothetical protein
VATTIDPDRSRALLVGLVDDARGDVVAHRSLRRDRDALGALLVRVSDLGMLLDDLDAARGQDPVDLVLVADTGLVEAGEARSILLDDDRVTLVGIDVALPVDEPADEAARITLDTLDLAVPATIRVPPGERASAGVAVIAEDGAESVGLDGADPSLADLLVACVRAGARFRVDGCLDGAQVLAVLAATAAALEGRGDSQVAALLASTDPEPARALLADPAAGSVRRRLLSVRADDPERVLDELNALGLTED